VTPVRSPVRFTQEATRLVESGATPTGFHGVLVQALVLLFAIVPLAVASLSCGGAGARRVAQAGAASSATGPAAAFFRDPALSYLRLSPDGRQLAAIATVDGVQVLLVRPTLGGPLRLLAKLDEVGQSIRMVGWASDERILVSVEMPSEMARGVRARQTRLLVVPVDGSRPRYLGRDWPYQEYSQFQDHIIDWLWDDPEHVLMSWWQPGERGTGVRSVNVGSGKLRTVTRAIPDVTGWASDHRGQVRAAWGDSGSQMRVFVYARADADDGFEKLIEFDPFEEKGFYFAAFSEEPTKLYVTSNDETGRDAVYSYDLATKQLGPMVFGHPDVDVESLYSSAIDGRLLAIGYVTDRPRLHFVDPKARDEQALLDRRFPGTTNRIIDRDRDEKLAIAQVSGDTKPPRYYLYDLVSGRTELLVEAYPKLHSWKLAPMKPVSFAARDGLEIPGYLTLPKGVSPKGLPAILYIHGGPSSRDVWGWEPTVQLLASRGFAVLQPNFRGSTGYGAKHAELGLKQWGLAMQDDVEDAARWLIEQGIADPARIGIYGASYGGYAALMALVKTPELFAAAASLAGVTDLPTLLADDKWYRFGDWNKPVVGDRGSDRRQLEETSPVQQAERIRAPVLIAHGTEDPRVHVKHAEMMVDALADRSVEVETLLYQGEVHGFIHEANAIDFHDRLVAFFERNLALQAPGASDTEGE
jgi:dipeptidyl aminopeptidase/acylaminoacyl peptidase